MAVALARPSVEPILMNAKKADIITKKLTASSLEEMIERMPFDLLYVENISLALDILKRS